MTEMLSYIFESLQASEGAVRSIKRTLKRQARFNKAVAILIYVMTICVITVEIRNREQGRRIEKLDNEIKELKRMKGE